MVRSNAQPHEPPRCRQPLDHVDLEAKLRVEQSTGGVEAGRARADYGNADSHQAGV